MKLLNYLHRERFNQFDIIGLAGFGFCLQAGQIGTGFAFFGGTFVLDVIVGTIISMRARP